MKTNPDDPVPDPVPDTVPDPVPDPVPTSDEKPLEIIPAGDDPANFPSVDELVKRTARILRQGMQNSRKGLKEIFEGTLHLIDLQLHHSVQGTRNDLFPDAKKSGFLRALEEANTPTTTAYRWIQNVRPFLLEIGITDANFPLPDTEQWVKMVKSVKWRIEHLNGLGLQVRAIPIPSDEEILTRLRTAAAAGYEDAKQLLRELEAGEITMDEATRRYCQVDKGAKRPTPALIKINSKTLKTEGRVIKAMDVVEEFFLCWDQVPIHIQLQVRARIREVFGKLPPDCGFQDD